MDSTTASRMVIVSGGLLATYVMLEAKRRGRPSEDTYRSLWAVGALTLGLSVLADFAPKVAGPFALLVLVAAAARNTGALGNLMGGAGSGVGSRPAGTAPSKALTATRGGK